MSKLSDFFHFTSPKKAEPKLKIKKKRKAAPAPAKAPPKAKPVKRLKPKKAARKGKKIRKPKRKPRYIKSRSGVKYYRKPSGEYQSDSGRILDTLIVLSILSGSGHEHYSPDPTYANESISGQGGTFGGAGADDKGPDTPGTSY